jgi:hypothetical protein
MADKSRISGLKSLIPFRAKNQTGATSADLVNLADKMGYDVIVGRDGQVVPVPRDVGKDDINTGFASKWDRLWDKSGAKANNRDARMQSYERMDSAGAEGAVVLDCYADEVLTIVDSMKNSIMIKISDKQIREKVMRVLEMNGILASAREDVRSLCKNGDFVYIVHAAEGKELRQIEESTAETGVKIDAPLRPEDVFVTFMPGSHYKVDASPSKIFRLTPNEAQPDATIDRDLKPWEFAFFSIRNRDTYPYGMSILEKMRVPFEQLVVLEQLLAVTRANRMDRIAVSVPGIGGDPSSTLARLSALKNTIKTIVLGAVGGAQRLTRNQDISMTEYLWVPEGFKVEKLATSIEAGTVEDVEYFRDKLYNASRMPKGFFLASDGSGQTRPMTLKQQDIKFARTLIPVQDAFCLGFRQLVTLIAFYVGADISTLEVDVSIKKSPYISGELVETYQDVMNLVNNYISLRTVTDKEYQITKAEIKRLCDLVGAPYEIILADAEIDPENPDVVSSLYESTSYEIQKPKTLMDICRMGV